MQQIMEKGDPLLLTFGLAMAGKVQVKLITLMVPPLIPLKRPSEP